MTKRKAESEDKGYTEILQAFEIGESNDGVFDGLKWRGSRQPSDMITSLNPSTNEVLGYVHGGSTEDYEACMANMEKVREEWALVPAPRRGALVHKIGEKLRESLIPLANLISLEMGKIHKEAVGEVQEFIDMCDYAVGLSRTYDGKVFPSERPDHVLIERWNPLGHVGVITAFNFPNAVIGWNLCLALIVGDTVMWKGASSVSLISIATAKIIAKAIAEAGAPAGIFTLCQGSGRTVGERLITDSRIKLISFTGSTGVGTRVAEKCAQRFTKTILELGGNNGIIAMDDANIDLLVPSVIFGCIGTCGQRCTSTRRLLLHTKIYDVVLAKLLAGYKQVRIGNPLDASSMIGPLHTKAAVKEFLEGIAEIKRQGGKIIAGGDVVAGMKGNFVYPTIVEISPDAPIVKTELFVPILYVFRISSFDEALVLHNSVPQGLSSALFTNNQSHIFKWTGPTGSDCGLANVNTGTSGAEIGGAFGANKEGMGSESGSDSWKQYCRRTTSAINYSSKLTLAQGLTFSVTE